MNIFDCYELAFIFCLFLMCIYLLSKFNKHQRQILLLGNAVVTIGDIVKRDKMNGVDATLKKAEEILKNYVPKNSEAPEHSLLEKTVQEVSSES